MPSSDCLFVILAAGEGTRMRSARPKVMHALAGEPMLGHVLRAAIAAAPGAAIAAVLGPDMAEAADLVRRRAPEAGRFEQIRRLGTAHAVLAAREALAARADRDVVVVYGDTPLLRPETIARLRHAVAAGSDIAVLGFSAADPAGYGRLIVAGDRLTAIREERDATPEERAGRLCNGGAMAFRAGLLPSLLDEVGSANANGEYYLTDAVALAAARGLVATAVEVDEVEVMGVNSRAQLAVAEAALQARLRAAALDGGATLVAPETVFLSHDTALAPDVTIEPHVIFGPGVEIGEGATVRGFSHIEGARVAPGATVGPFARLRPGADIGAKSRIGNFVEVKAATIEAGAKVNHLSYVGDARVGQGANVGAGTITCNYDGHAKHHTDIGAGAFIGSNSALVAPVSIGDGAYVGSGSVITKDVPAAALAIGRARQVEKPGWVANLKKTSAGGGGPEGGSGS